MSFDKLLASVGLHVVATSAPMATTWLYCTRIAAARGDESAAQIEAWVAKPKHYSQVIVFLEEGYLTLRTYGVNHVGDTRFWQHNLCEVEIQLNEGWRNAVARRIRQLRYRRHICGASVRLTKPTMPG